MAGPTCGGGREGALLGTELPHGPPAACGACGGGWSIFADSQMAVPSLGWFQAAEAFSWLLLLPVLLSGLRGSFGDSSMSHDVS